MDHRRLSPTQREYLVDHVDGTRPVTVTVLDIRTRQALFALKLIRYEPHETVSKPKITVITDAGRRALCGVLADYAEKLLASDALLNRVQHPKAATSEERETLLRNLLALKRYDAPLPKGGAYGPIAVERDDTAETDHAGHGDDPMRRTD